jgi:hypothetical protein
VNGTQDSQNFPPVVLAFGSRGDHMQMALGDECAHHARVNGDIVEILGDEAPIVSAPIALTTRNVFE